MIAAEADYATLTVANVKAASSTSVYGVCCRSDMIQAVFSDVLFKGQPDSQS